MAEPFGSLKRMSPTQFDRALQCDRYSAVTPAALIKVAIFRFHSRQIAADIPVIGVPAQQIRPQLTKLFLDRRSVHCTESRAMKPLNNRGRRTLGHEERKPCISLEVSEALLRCARMFGRTGVQFFDNTAIAFTALVAICG